MLGKKKKTWSSLLAIILSLTCALSAIPVSAYGEPPVETQGTTVINETGSTGTADLEEGSELVDDTSGEETSEPTEEINGEEPEPAEEVSEDSEKSGLTDETESNPIEGNDEALPTMEELSEEDSSDNRVNLAGIYLQWYGTISKPLSGYR